MEDGYKIAIAAILGGVITYTLKFIEPKAKLVLWFPHSFFYKMDEQNIYTQSYSLQNLGYKSAQNIEIVHSKKPDFFKLHPSLMYSETFTPSGEHVLRIDFLAPKEFFTLEILSYTSLPELQYVRYDRGYARTIDFKLQPNMKPLQITILRILTITGGIAIVYATIRLAIYLYSLAFS